MGEQEQQGQHRDLQRDSDEDQPHMSRRGVRQRAFDVDLGQGHQGAADRTDAADHEHHADSDGRELQDRHHLQQHNRAAGHHNRIAENRGGIRALHGFVQPEVHRELGAFARRAGNQAQTQQRRGQRREGVLGGPGIEVVEPHHSGVAAERHHTHQQQHITNALGEEGIPGCGHHQGLGIPETHQQIGGEGQHFQQEIALEQGVAEHNAAHRPLKKSEQCKEAGQRPLLVHVSQGIHLGQQAEARDQFQGYQIGERKTEADIQLQIGHSEPRECQIHWP